MNRDNILKIETKQKMQFIYKSIKMFNISDSPKKYILK